MKISRTLLAIVVAAIIATAFATAQGEETGETCESPDIVTTADEHQSNEAGTSEVLYAVLRESGSGDTCQSENSLFDRQAGNPTINLYKGDSYSLYQIPT